MRDTSASRNGDNAVAPFMAPPAVDVETGSISGEAAGPFRAVLHDSIDAIEPLWRHAEKAGYATPFQRFDWLKHLIDAVARMRGVETFAIEVTDARGRSVMLLPLARERRGTVTVISVIDFDTCDYLAPVLLPGPKLAPETVSGLWTAIRNALPAADVFTIPKMPASIGGRDNPLLGVGGVREMTTIRQFGLPIGLPAQDLIRRVTRDTTFRDIAKFRRRLAKRGAVQFAVASTPEEADAIVTVMLSQRRERFRAIGRENLMDRPEIEHFYRDAAAAGVAGGPVRVGGLTVDGEWVGTSYGLLHANSFALVAQTMAGGEWRNLSPGILTTVATMEWAATEGLTYFDFTIGTHAYKADLGAIEGPLYEVSSALSARGALLLASERTARVAKDAIRRYPRLYHLAKSWRSRK